MPSLGKKFSSSMSSLFGKKHKHKDRDATHSPPPPSQEQTNAANDAIIQQTVAAATPLLSQSNAEFRRRLKGDDNDEECAEDRVFASFVKGGLDDLLKKYEVKQSLGSGTFSEVHRCVSFEDSTHYALKIIPKNNQHLRLSHLHTEIGVLQRVRHRGIVNLVELYECGKFLFMILDMMEGGEVMRHIQEFHPLGYSEKNCGRIISRILETVEYLHTQNIIHRDLKPENLLYADKEDCEDIRITDFGLAKMISAEWIATTACGSPCYVAPEVLRNATGGYTSAADMWSCGVILYVTLCGFCPFYDDNLAVLYQKICSGIFTFPAPYWDPISEGPKDLIRKLLVVEPCKRITATEARNHFWLLNEKEMNDETIPGIKESWDEFKDRRDRKPTNEDNQIYQKFSPHDVVAAACLGYDLTKPKPEKSMAPIAGATEAEISAQLAEQIQGLCQGDDDQDGQTPENGGTPAGTGTVQSAPNQATQHPNEQEYVHPILGAIPSGSQL